MKLLRPVPIGLLALLPAACLAASQEHPSNDGAAPAHAAAPAANQTDNDMQHQSSISHPYTGMWVTADGHIRHELLPSGRYDEARGNRQSAYQGRYEITGNHIDYWDDTGFTADGTFVDNNTLHHAGMVFYRQE